MTNYRWNETYTWSNVNCCVHNIIVGKLWIEQYGTMEIINHTNGTFDRYFACLAWLLLLPC